MKLQKNKIIALFLCFVLGFTIAACAPKPEPIPIESSISSSEESQIGDGTRFYNALDLPEGPYALFTLPDMTEKVIEKREQNADTVGWLKVPNTTIDDVVVWYPGDKNDYYYRRNFEKAYSFGGIFYADYRCTFDGGSKGLAPNTVIYGHSMSDDPLDSRKLFSPITFYRDQEYAKANPYIFFSVAEEDLVWEVFAVFIATVELPYNIPNPQDFAGIISECQKRSIYTYDTQISASDKILTLSTCIYNLPNGTNLGYPNNYRYAVMAKLVNDTANLKEEATFEVNPSPKAP